jgi:hypothetical protein
MLKRNTRKAMLQIGLFLTMICILFSLGGYLLNEPIWFGLIVLVGGIICIVTPIVFVLITPLEKLEKERKKDGGWGWK